jgi:hypothetical protein
MVYFWSCHSIIGLSWSVSSWTEFMKELSWESKLGVELEWILPYYFVTTLATFNLKDLKGESISLLFNISAEWFDTDYFFDLIVGSLSWKILTFGLG